MEHELSAIYDITHGLGLAILTPRWMKYCLDETLPPMEIANKGIEMMEKFLFETLGLKSSFTDIGIDESHFEVMAEKAVRLGGLAYAFKPLAKEDVVNIFKMCL